MNHNLQLSLDKIAAKCEVVGMSNRTSKSETMVLSPRRLACPLQADSEGLSQEENSKYLVGLVQEWGKNEVVDEQADWCGTSDSAPVHSGEAELKDKTLCLSVNLSSYPHLCSLTVCRDQKNEIMDANSFFCRVAGLSLTDKVIWERLWRFRHLFCVPPGCFHGRVSGACSSGQRSPDKHRTCWRAGEITSPS